MSLVLQGKDAVAFLETLVVGDVAGIKNGSGSLSVFTNEEGGIIDDTVITKVRSHAPVIHPCITQVDVSNALDGLGNSYAAGSSLNVCTVL